MADWRTDLLRSIGGKPTPSALGFLQGWQAKEGGATHNQAHFNWLNRTDKGYPTINSVGVSAYPNYRTGIARTAQLIQSGYPAIFNSLRSGQVSFQDPNLQGDLNRWVSGSRTPGMSPYVSSVARLSGLGGGAPAASGGTPQTIGRSAAPPPSPAHAGLPSARPTLHSVMPLVAALSARREDRQAGRPSSIAGLVTALMAMRSSPQVPPEHQVQDIAAPTRPGKLAPPASGGGKGFKQLPMAGQWSGTHVTDGLGWGTKTAEDIMGHPGEGVGAPEDGTIEYFHPTGAQGGGSMMLKTGSGREYWLGHIADGLPEGTVVRRGQQIATISGDHPRPHVHIDYRG